MATFQTSDGVEIFYRDRGAGDAVMLLHSFATSGAVFELQAVALAPQYRVITPDLRGSGRSDHPAAGNTVARNARDMIELLRRLEIGRVILAGSSIGGNIALRCALDAPDLVGGVITIGAPFDSLEGQPDHPVLRTMIDSLRAGRPRAFANMAGNWLGPLGDEALRSWLVSLLLQSSGFLENLVRDAAYEKLASRLSELRLPIALFHGAMDTSAPVEISQSAAQRLPNARLVLFERCRHLPHLEDPETFNLRLRNEIEHMGSSPARLAG